MPNTEKPQSLAAKKQQGLAKAPKQKPEVSKAPVQKTEEEVEKTEANQEEKSTQPIIKRELKKKNEVVVRGVNLPISTKYSMAICKFIKNKKINDAIRDLEQVVILKKAVPMKGEIPHRKGKGMMSGRFPKKASEHFIKLLKNLRANANNHDIVEPVIVEAIANIGARPYGRFGSVRRKRTHVKIIARTKKANNKIKKKVGGEK